MKALLCVGRIGLLVVTGGLNAQAPVLPAATTPPPPPATKMEAFAPAAGTVLTFGYDELGRIGGLSVDVRELRDTKGNAVRGLVVEVSESQYRRERSFVDEEEIPELLQGIDALLLVSTNPTAFKQFEVRYTTKGELQITAFNQAAGSIRYSVRAGRTLSASQFFSQSDLQKLRAMFVAAQEKLGQLPR